MPINNSLKFHIKSQDYFGTLATILSLCRQTGQEIPEHIISDLMYLQENYQIEKKIKRLSHKRESFLIDDYLSRRMTNSFLLNEYIQEGLPSFQSPL